MDTRTKEAIRYLGYGRHAVDDKTHALIQDSFHELDRVAEKRIIYRIFDVSLKDDNRLNIGKMEIKSRNLSRNLRDCREAILLGATLGIGVDMLLKRYGLTDMSKAVVLQAAAAALLEEYLDTWQQNMAEKMAAREKYLRPRFSPGYGDFDIEHQEMILRMLDAGKTIGLAMTNSSMLTPTKSVTAVIGISSHEERCPIQGCESCGKLDCSYRRNT